ncbi:MAG: outer membrane beta-barrel protein [Alphaproteobacteria bacterium]|nr:outer membrane beta-barrel protein [Alphaproteobacteria bacterium]
MKKLTALCALFALAAIDASAQTSQYHMWQDDSRSRGRNNSGWSNDQWERENHWENHNRWEDEYETSFYITAAYLPSVSETYKDEGLGNENYSGTGFSVGLGMEMGQIRGEILYTQYDIDYSKIQNSLPPNTEEWDFKSRTHSIMLNGFYNFFERGEYPINPYVGAGIGLTRVKSDEFTFVNTSGTTGGGIAFDDYEVDSYIDENLFTYMLGLGLLIDLTDQLSIDIGYRYNRLADATIKTDYYYFENGTATAVDFEFRDDKIKNWTFQGFHVGVKLSF